MGSTRGWRTLRAGKPARIARRLAGFDEANETGASQNANSCKQESLSDGSASLPLGAHSSHDFALASPASGCRCRTQAVTPPASGDTRANTNAGVGPPFTSDVLVANLGTRRVVDRPAVVPTSAEYCFGMNAGATPGGVSAVAKMLTDHLTRAGQQAPLPCRSHRQSRRHIKPSDLFPDGRPAGAMDRGGRTPPSSCECRRSSHERVAGINLLSRHIEPHDRVVGAPKRARHRQYRRVRGLDACPCCS
jgi:hypothetical protein